MLCYVSYVKCYVELCENELGIAFCFNILMGPGTSGNFSFYFDQPLYELERPALEMHILWCRTDICSCKLSAKISLMLNNPFPVASFFKLNQISICCIQISKKITYRQVICCRERCVFLKMIPGVLGR